MGFLEDIVKLKGGQTVGEALSSIGKSILEQKVASEAAPMVANYANMFLPTGAAGEIKPGSAPQLQNPEDIQAASSRLMMDLLNIPGSQFTDTFKTINENVQNAAKGSMSARKGMADVRQSNAYSARLDAGTDEQIKQTKLLEKPLTEADLAFFPAPQQSYLKERLNKGEVVTYREAMGISQVEEPYIRLAIAKLSLANSQEERKANLFNFRKDYLYPALGSYATLVTAPTDEQLMKGDINGIVKNISNQLIKKKGDNPDLAGLTDDQIYVLARDRVMNAFKSSGATATAQGEAQRVNAAVNAGQIADIEGNTSGYGRKLQGAVTAPMDPDRKVIEELNAIRKDAPTPISDSGAGQPSPSDGVDKVMQDYESNRRPGPGELFGLLGGKNTKWARSTVDYLKQMAKIASDESYPPEQRRKAGQRMFELEAELRNNGFADFISK